MVGPHSLTPHSLSPHSLTPHSSLPHSSLPHSLTPSLPHSLTPSLLTPSLLTPSLLTPSLPHSLTPSLPHSLTPSLPHSLTQSCPVVVVHLAHLVFSSSEATLKKSLFPVQRVAEIVASRAAANLFFPPLFFLVRKFFGGQNEKKEFPFCSNIHTRLLDRKQYFFKGGLMEM